MSNTKISIRFFDDREVRAAWDQENAKWWFSVLDIVAILTDQNDYNKTRNYWKYLDDCSKLIPRHRDNEENFSDCIHLGEPFNPNRVLALL
jgi:hypothetical protein